MIERRMGERVASLETDMQNVKNSQEIMFAKMDSFGKWLIASACSAAGGLVLLVLTIIFKKMGIL